MDEWDRLQNQQEDNQAMLELIKESGEDEEMLADLDRAVNSLIPLLEELETQTLLGGDQDQSSAFLNINAGSGGTESQDWAQMLLRMYLRWSEKKNFKASVIEVSAGEEAGIKSATIQVSGEFAYGLLRSESGVHRLVRISPFDANSRRHTSFASVYIYPEIAEDVEIDIDESECRIDVYRSSGAGGQHVNTTDSAVRITHNPSGIVVTCQNERSQHKNKATAWKMLKARLYERHLEEERAKRADVEASKMANEWGSQIRSYVLHPYKMVKDHRTGEETSSADSVLDGAIDPFVRSFLLFDKGMLERNDD